MKAMKPSSQTGTSRHENPRSPRTWPSVFAGCSRGIIACSQPYIYNTVWLLSNQLHSTPPYINHTEPHLAGDMQRESPSKEAASPADAPVPLRAGRIGYWTSNLDLTWQTYLPVLLVLSFAAGCGSARSASWCSTLKIIS
jgi:hypothetical protein